MRIVQLIDSLETGGAERMAVNYANALADSVEFSGLVATRNEGSLKSQLNSKVNYLFLNRKSTFDIKAILKLRKYIKQNKIDVLHAHSSSFLIAVLVKLVSNVKVVWHDHFGNSEFLSERPKKALQLASFFFYRIIVVNNLLEKWSKNNLYCKNIQYLPNFVLFENSNEIMQMQGENGKRILCLANLRPQKNHDMLIDAAKTIKANFPDWTFHLIGKDFKDNYSELLHKRIIDEGLNSSVFIYGSSDKIVSAIQQSDIGVLTSLSEGLPVSLLEYGYFELPVVSTSVGEIPYVINKENGVLVQSEDVSSFVFELEKLIINTDLRKTLGAQLKKDIHLNYTREVVIQKYLNPFSNVNE